MNQLKSEIRDGMQIDWDAPIEMEDGLILRADIFRPIADEAPFSVHLWFVHCLCLQLPIE